LPRCTVTIWFSGASSVSDLEAQLNDKKAVLHSTIRISIIFNILILFTLPFLVVWLLVSYQMFLYN